MAAIETPVDLTRLVASEGASNEEQLPAPPLSDHARASETRRLQQAPEHRAVDAALRYFPASRDWEVDIIDPEFAADPVAIRALDAFTVRDGAVFRKKAYLNRESRILQEAARGVDFYVKVLGSTSGPRG